MLLDWSAGLGLQVVVIEDDFADTFAAENFFSDVIDISVGANDGDGGRFCGFVGLLSELGVGVECGFGLLDEREGNV